MGRRAGGHRRCSRERRRVQARDDDQSSGSPADRWRVAGSQREHGSVASTIWVNRASPAQSIVFITIDGESVAHGRTLDLEPNPYTENGGES
jgi:hypothetical protein